MVDRICHAVDWLFQPLGFGDALLFEMVRGVEDQAMTGVEPDRQVAVAPSRSAFRTVDQNFATFGLPDDDLGQRIHAIVQTRVEVAESALCEYLTDHLVRYKIPRNVEFVDQPLRDDAGKVRRSALREARLPTD